MYNNSFFKQILLVATIILFASCDKDYNEIGADLIGQNNFNIVKDSLSTVEASTEKTGPIASNNLDINSLGVLDNSVFGQTTANYATQVQLTSINPTIDFNLDQEVESVTLYIPYFAKKTSTAIDGRSTYVLDSIYGNPTSKINLRIYENKYLLGNKNTDVGAPIIDADFPQLYYTNQNTLFNEKKGELLFEKKEFSFSDEAHLTSPTTAETKTYEAPGMKLELEISFFQKLLFDNSSNGYSLKNNPEFEEYFKGLYFNVEKVGDKGVLARMNFKNGKIVVKYKEKALATDATVSIDKSITLNLTGNTVNLLDNKPSTAPESYSTPNSSRLYLRGGDGSIATIDLFNPAVDDSTYNRKTKKIEKGSNSIPDELDRIKEKGWLINEARLTFYVDQALMSEADSEPTNIFLYDINNQRVFAAGTIEKDAAKRGLKYRVNITDYIRGLLNNDNVNVKIGVSVAQTISNVKFKKTQKAPLYSIWKGLTTIQKNAYFFPESSVMNPLGTILYGSKSTVPEDKRLKLEIYYTKPN
jgi:hypothetical protein